MLTSSAANADTPLRVMTFNIKSGAHGLPAVAAAIREARPDVVALQEVDAGTRRSGGVDQADALAALTGLSHAVFVPATELDGGAYGVAILSRGEIRDVRVRRLPVYTGLEPRVFARAEVELDGERLAVYVTHLSHLPTRASLRAEQADAILRALSRETLPHVLMGDLNETAGSRAVRRLSTALTDAFAAAGRGGGGTYRLPVPLGPSLRFDYVFTSSEITPVSARVLPGEASDHHPVIADVIVRSAGVVSARAAR